MLSNQNVLPNFLKTILFASATVLSMNAFAESTEVQEFKDVTVDESTVLKDDVTEDVKTQAEIEAEANARLEAELEKAPKE